MALTERDVFERFVMENFAAPLTGNDPNTAFAALVSFMLLSRADQLTRFKQWAQQQATMLTAAISAVQPAADTRKTDLQNDQTAYADAGQTTSLS